MAKKQVHRLCPCDQSDIEGIQSWLEDMAGQGLFLVEDGVFCGVFTFERKALRKVAYRLDVVQKRKPRFLESADELSDEEVALYHSMGWEYLLRYGEFRIYRAETGDVPELNTETETHAITINLLKKKYRSYFINAVLMALLWFVGSNGFLRYGFMMAVTAGVVFLLCMYTIVLWLVITPLARAFRFRRYEKRLLAGDDLNRRVDWKKRAAASMTARVVPVLLCCGIAFGLLSGLAREDDKVPNSEYPGNPPFATVEDVFPGGVISDDNIWMDYGTHSVSKTMVSENIEWSQSCDVTTQDGEQYFCILRLSYHETASEWIAQGLEKDYYVYDASSHHGKRFEDLQVPALGVDSVRVYNSYGSIYVLMRHGNRVVHGVVHIDGGDQNNEWILWAQAMAEMLK